MGAISEHVEPDANSESGEDVSEVGQSEAPASAGPGSASPATLEAELSGEGTDEADQTSEEPSDWSTLAPELSCGVEVTPAVHETLAAPHR